MAKFVQCGNQYIRKPNGEAVNLNSPQGADYVLDLQRRVVELERVDPQPKRRRKVGPKESK